MSALPPSSRLLLSYEKRGFLPLHLSKRRGDLPRTLLPYLAFLQAEGFHHRRGEVGVVVHYLPSVSFATVDVRHTPFEVYRLVSDLPMAALGAHGVGGILCYGNYYYVFQRHLPTGERLCGPLPGGPHFLPSEY